MKNTLAIIIALGISTPLAHAAPDCIDDDGNFLKVACNHNCYKDPHARLVENKGKCSICGHYHMPRSMVMIKTANPETLTAPIKKAKVKNTLAHIFAFKKNKK